MFKNGFHTLEIIGFDEEILKNHTYSGHNVTTPLPLGTLLHPDGKVVATLPVGGVVTTCRPVISAQLKMCTTTR